MKFYDQEITIIGQPLQVGQSAPEFTANGKDWKPVTALASTQGKVRIIGSLPSVSSSVCNRETRRFNQEAADLGEQVAILMVSMDLPWTAREWCAAAGIERVQVLSDAQRAEFGPKYGVLMAEPRILARSIFVVDRGGKIVYADYMPSIGEEPKYDEVLAAARQALQA